jgi:hypothetical protein
VVKDFVSEVRGKAVGAEVVRGVSPRPEVHPGGPRSTCGRDGWR